MRNRLLSVGFAAGTDGLAELRADILRQDGIYKKIITDAGIKNE
jgi:hypothetical protein